MVYCSGGFDRLSVTTINLFGNILLKSVKIPFSGNTEILGFKRNPPIFARGSEFIPF